mmetsp:Transcript_13616/g.29300  ORF Transcript_13616/g.29300 Transcript_13616/m.29300 type:complete len:953 (-) Transcript_13616:3046-5904(-)
MTTLETKAANSVLIGVVVEGSIMSDSEQSSSDEAVRSEEEDESDDSVGADSKKRRIRNEGSSRKKKRRAPNAFFEEEADEDDESEGEAAEEERGDAEYDEHEEETKKRLDRRLAQRDQFHSRPAEEIARELERRHQMKSRTAWEQNDDGVTIPRSAFLPTVSDPKLFAVKCKPGEEKMLCLQLMNKYVNSAQRGKKLHIYSCLTAGTKGFIYVEARNQQHASAAIEGIRGVFRFKITMVPLGEMPQVLKVVTQKTPLKVGDFVRLRRFPYKGDLAKVFHMSDSGKIVVRFVPRLDFSSFDLTPEEQKQHRAKKIIPPKRFFNAEEVLAAGGRPERKRYLNTDETMDFCDDEYYKDGYLVKEYNERFVQTKDVRPSLEELQEFRHGRQLGADEEEDADEALEDGNLLEELGNTAVPTREGEDKKANAAAAIFKKGDVVVVREGELQHLKGEVVAVGVDGVVKINPLDESVRGSLLDFDASDLMKLFHVGDHIKVISGRYAGETGNVVKIIEDTEKWKAIVFTDSETKEIVVFVDDLQISAEIAQARDSLAGIKLLDLVSLGAQVGVVVKVGSETLNVLLQNGTVKIVSVQEIRRKLNNNSKDTTAMDKTHNSIAQNNIVKIVSGENAGMEGTIKHIHRSFLFLHSRMRLANAGIFVERARNVQLAGVKMRNASGFGVQRPGAPGGGGGRGGRGRGRGRKDDMLVGKSVRIKTGRFKGYIGMAVSATEDTVKVEIHSKKKMVEMRREKVAVIGDENGQRVETFGGGSDRMGRYGSSGYGGQSSSSYVPPSTYGSATPMQPSTPGGSNAARADAWNPEIGGGAVEKPPTPGAAEDDAWDPSQDAASSVPAYRPPPTPAFGGSYGGSGGISTPAAVATPATPAVPATPAAPLGGGYMDDDGETNGLQQGDKVKIIGGEDKGETGVLRGIDGNDAIVTLGTNKDNVRIINLKYIKKD